MTDASPIALLYDKLTRKLSNSQGVHLSRDELDWLVLSGAYRTLVLAAADQAFIAARSRVEVQDQHQDDLGDLTEAYQSAAVRVRVVPPTLGKARPDDASS
jgi:hypothetical protein